MTGEPGDTRPPLTAIERVERQKVIVALRAAGETWTEIGHAVGLSDRQAIREAQAYQEGLRRQRRRMWELAGSP
jgi:hypothetical protein